jgi:dethiobiotin synthetase
MAGPCKEVRFVKAHGVFVIGTDTGVGKTAVTAALAVNLTRRGLSSGVMKPIETGWPSERPETSDAARLRSSVAGTEALDLITPYRFDHPLAPLAAARQAGIVISLETLLGAFRTMAGRYPYMLVEGLGGLCVPLTEREDLRDLVAHIGLPVVVVGRAAIGGVNHALLAVEAIKSRSIPVAALVLNQACPTGQGPDARLQRDSTVQLLKERSGVPVVGPLPYEAAFAEDWEAGLSKLALDPGIDALADLLIGRDS